MWSNIWILYISRYISRNISLLDVPDQKSTLCQADNTRSEPLLEKMMSVQVRRMQENRHVRGSKQGCTYILSYISYPHTPTDYRHIDKHLRLIITPIALCCTRQSCAPNIDCCTPEIWLLTLTHDLNPGLWPWPRPLTLNSDDFGIWPWPLSYDLDLPSKPSLGQPTIPT